MSQRRVILAGHSHAVALGLAFASKRHAARLAPIPGRGEGVFGLNGNPRVPRYWDRLVDEAAGATILLVWSGNQHLVRFLLASEPRFDLFLARHPMETPDTEASLVPEAVARTVLREPILPLASLLARLARVRGCRPIVVGTPPPLGDDDRLRAVIVREAKGFQGGEAAGFDAASAPLTDRNVRRRLWRVVQDLLSETAGEAGVPFVASPAGGADHEGFLRSDLSRGDASHANAAYGDLVWADLEPVLARTL